MSDENNEYAWVLSHGPLGGPRVVTMHVANLDPHSTFIVELPDGRKGSWSVEEFVALLEGAGAFGPFAGMTFEPWQETWTGPAYLRTTEGIAVAEAWPTQGVVYAPGVYDVAVEGGDLETVKQRIVGELRSRGAKL